MRCPIDKGSSSPRFRMPLAIKPDAMINTHRQLQHNWSLTQDINMVRKPQAQFDVNNWDKPKSTSQSLTAFATASLKDDLLWKRQAVSLESYSHDEPELKRQSLTMVLRL